MKRSLTEFWVGLFVLGGILAIAILAFRVDGAAVFAIERNYKIYAKFDDIGGLAVKAPVTIAGVTIGRVSDINVNMNDFSAHVELSISDRFDSIPIDSSARILTAGLLGAQYVGLEQGGEDAFLQSGDLIEFTQPAFSLEDLLSGMLFRKSTDE